MCMTITTIITLFLKHQKETVLYEKLLNVRAFFFLANKSQHFVSDTPNTSWQTRACCPPDKNDETRNFCEAKLPKCFHVMDLLWCLLVFWVRRVSFWRCPGHPRLNDQSRCLSSAQLSF